jgi:DNA-binding MarR family transcriptional regulator
MDNGAMPALEEETGRFLAAWMQIRQLVQASNFNRFQRAGLSATQFMTLNVLPPAGATLSELARQLNLGAATLHQTVNSLEERKLLTRAPHPSDRRKTTILATRAGEQLQNSASREFQTLIAGLFAKMSKTRREGLLAGLEELATLGAASVAGEASPTRRPAGRPRLRPDAAAPAKRSARQSPPR